MSVLPLSDNRSKKKTRLRHKHFLCGQVCIHARMHTSRFYNFDYYLNHNFPKPNFLIDKMIRSETNLMLPLFVNFPRDCDDGQLWSTPPSHRPLSRSIVTQRTVNQSRSTITQCKPTLLIFMVYSNSGRTIALSCSFLKYVFHKYLHPRFTRFRRHVVSVWPGFPLKRLVPQSFPHLP